MIAQPEHDLPKRMEKKMKFKDLKLNDEVYVHVGDEWVKGRIVYLNDNDELNPGRELVELRSPWLECGWGMFDAEEDIYPAPDFDTTYTMIDIVERIPDNRVYEFGIGDINNADDPYYVASPKTKPTGKRKMVLLKKCDGCHGEFPSVRMMSASLGRACPDCYDRMSG